MASKTYSLKSNVLVYPGMGGWRFLPVPKREAVEIRAAHGAFARGWGSIRVSVTIGKTVWDTSIFPDKASGTYLLPLKAEVREAEGIADGATVKFGLRVR